MSDKQLDAETVQAIQDLADYLEYDEAKDYRDRPKAERDTLRDWLATGPSHPAANSDDVFGQGNIVFYCAPGASSEDPIIDKMLRAHEAEARKQRARFHNYGWGQGENGICSKTSKGKLSTTINRETMHVSHEWHA
jgi:hypothetical protein